MKELDKLTEINATILIDIYKDHNTTPLTSWQVAEWYCDQNIISEKELMLLTNALSAYLFDNVNTRQKKKKQIDRLFKGLSKKYGWSKDTHDLIIEKQINKVRKEFK